MFDDICARILSPPKFKYSIYDLGSALTKFGKRTDFIVYNKKLHKMNCSLYQPHIIKHDRVCVVYLHSMNGSRLQGLMYSQFLLQQGISYCTFDFSGCGNSDGQKISFGASQKYDIQIIVKKLKETFYLNKFLLWGRSMGAVAAVKYAQLCYEKSKSTISYQKEQILGMILDSPFKSLSQLLVQIGHTQTQIPRFLIKAGYFFIKNALQQNGQFKIKQLDLINPNSIQNNSLEQNYPLNKVRFLQLPILFLASKQDKTVPCQHSIDMFNSYNCKMKDIGYFRGLHNESREGDYLEKIFEFMKQLLNINNSIEKSQNFPQPSNTANSKNLKNPSIQLFGKDNFTAANNSQPIQFVTRKMSTKQLLQPLNNIDNNHYNNIDTIPDPLTLQYTSNKPTIIQLIQERFFKSSTDNDGTQTLLEAQTIQSSCVCTMFDNNLQKTARDKYHNKNSIKNDQNFYSKNNNKKLEQMVQKDILLKNYNWSKYQQNKPNFNCDRISLKDSQKNNKNRSNQLETQSPYQSMKPQYYGPIYNYNDRQKSLVGECHTQKIITSRSIANKSIIRTIHLPLFTNQDQMHINHTYKDNNISSSKQPNPIFNQLYKPLRTASQKDLRASSDQRYNN